MFSRAILAIKRRLPGPRSPKLVLSQQELTAVVAAAVKEAYAAAPIRIDIADIMAQLNTSAVEGAVRNYLTRNNRFVYTLTERNRRAARDTFDFIDAHMRSALLALDQFSVIESHKEEIAGLGGNILDLGVYKGGSTRNLARIFPDRIIHGFDSFEGLPEDWSHARKGSFGDVKGILPNMPANVRLYKGWFDDTLPVWAKEHGDETISLLRVDCNIYSSTKTIFRELGNLLRPGSWICFDELIGYYGWQDHEYKAFMEFVDETGYRYEYISYGLTYTLARLGQKENG